MNATFNEVFDKYIELMKKSIEESSIETYLKVKTKINLYEKKNRCKMSLNDFTLTWFKDWSKGLTTGKYGKCGNSTIHLFTTILLGFLNKSIKFGYVVSEDRNAFKAHLDSFKKVKNQKPIFYAHELATFYKYKGYTNKYKKFFPITAYKAYIKDLFVFQTQIGCRWGDLSRIEKRHLIPKGESFYMVDFVTQKRKKPVTAHVNELAIDIVKRYNKDLDKLKPNEKVFKKVPDSTNATHVIKWICEKAKLERKVEVSKAKGDKVKNTTKPFYAVISTHVARHNFASYFMMNNGDIYKLSKILGHSSVKTTERYLQTIPGYIPEGIDVGMDSMQKKLFGLTG